MAIQKYLSLNGRLRGSYVTRSQKTWFLTDALGSVTATLNNSGNVVSTYRYKPYGATLATTGVGDPQRFGWAGDTGSRNSDRRFAEQYNWHRHYGDYQGQWTTRDILWPKLNAFEYVRSRPTIGIDPWGLMSNLDHEGMNTSVPPSGIELLPPKFDPCIRFSIPIPLPSGNWSFSGKFCYEAYDTKCCQPPAAAYCKTWALALQFKLSGKSFDPKELGTFQLDSILAAIFGVSQVWAGTVPQPKCVAPEAYLRLSLCLRFCFVMTSFELCGNVYTPNFEVFQYTFSGQFKFGYCGAPSIAVRLSLDGKNCT